MKKIITILLFGFISITDAKSIGADLDWLDDPASGTMCEGYYSEPLLVEGQETGWSVRSNKAEGGLSGNVRLKGNVVIHKSGQLVKAKQGHFFRNSKTHKLERVYLSGDVQMRRTGRLILGENALLFLNDDKGTIHQAVYRFSDAQSPSRVVNYRRRWYGMTAWGQAETLEQVSKNVYKMTRASYATCPPSKYMWQLVSGVLDIDKEKGVGYSRDTRLKLGGHTVFYWPYFSFPADKRRKSGFLMPSMSHTSRSGTDLSIPYYFNLAPNYDVTLTPHYLGARGFLAEGEGRYLSKSAHGDIKLAFINHDERFARQKNKLKRQGESMNSMGTKRLGGAATFDKTFNPQWRFKLNYLDVSDDYFFHDLSSNLLIPNQSHLPQQAKLSYERDIKLDNTMAWQLSESRFDIDFSRFRTLHPVEERAIIDQYSTLPRLRFNNAFRGGDFEFKLDSEASYFEWPNRAIVSRVNGQRLLLQPRLSYLYEPSYGFFKPSLWAHANYYSLRDANKFLANDLQIVPDHKSLFIPYATVDMGLYFDKNWTSRYTQTLIPRLYYVNIPEVEQNTLPLFDTSLKSFSQNYLFTPNRFSGGDRLGDSHHMSYELRSKWVDHLSNRTFMEISLGQMRYFKTRKEGFCYGRGCQPLFYISPEAETSPWIGQFKFDWGSHFSSDLNYAWLHNPREARLATSYHDEPNKIVTLYYDYARRRLKVNEQGDYTFNKVENLGTAFAWPLAKHWQMLGSWGYNLTDDNAHTYFMGLEYESCCWASRIVGGRKLLYVDVNGQAKYDNAIYIQFLIKGLSSVGSSPKSLITAALPGYKDKFTGIF